MKMQKEKYDILKNNFKIMLEHYGHIVIKTHIDTFGINRALWSIFYELMRDMRNDDNHPHFKNGRWTRIVPYMDDFDLLDGLNDEHINTALKQIGKDLHITK